MSNDQNPSAEGSQNHNETQNSEPIVQNEELEYESFSDNIDPITTQKNENHEDKNTILKLKDELAKTKDLMMRSVAEAENGRKRALKDREDTAKFAVSKFARDLLSVADNLRRALDSTPSELIEQNPQFKNLIDGIEATERELLRAFDKNNINKTQPLGEQFDPNFHEVMFETPMPDKKAGEIIQVLEAGYILNGRLLRPALVGIAKNTNEPAPTEPGQTIDTKA